MPENTAPVNSLPRWTPSVEERKIARRDAIPIAVYLESTDHETADWIGEFEQAIKYGGSILMSKQFCSAVTSLLATPFCWRTRHPSPAVYSSALERTDSR